MLISKTNMIMLSIIIIYNVVMNYITLFILPREAELGELYRIIYIHVPTAWASYVAFSLALLFSLLFLYRNDVRYDVATYVNVVLGTAFIGFSIISGSIFSNKA